MSFKSTKRELQVRWKRETPLLTDGAKRAGKYTGGGGQGRRDDMFLHEDSAAENLFPEIRDAALATFANRGIDWHDGPSPNCPSNYLMDSMVSCVTCPFAQDRRHAARLPL